MLFRVLDSSGENEKKKEKTGYGDNQKLFELIYLQAIISVIDKKKDYGIYHPSYCWVLHCFDCTSIVIDDDDNYDWV